MKRALAARSVHMRIVPRPANLSESREILRVLRRFGEVSMFKYMKYEYQNPIHNAALAIFRDASSAQAALDASPIRFALEQIVPTDSDNAQFPSSQEAAEDDTTSSSTQPLSNPPSDNLDDILRPSQLLPHDLPSSIPSPPPPTPPPMPFDTSPTPTTSTTTSYTKPFLLTLDRSRVIHADFIERQPWYKYFHPMRSLAQHDLAPQVPHPGLSDVSKRPPNAWRTPNRVLRTMSEYVEHNMPSLKKIAEGTDGDYEERVLQRQQRGK